MEGNGPERHSLKRLCFKSINPEKWEGARSNREPCSKMELWKKKDLDSEK